MKNKILTEDLCKDEAKKFEAKIFRCAKNAVKMLKQKSKLLSVNFVFLTEEEIKTLNKETRQKDEVTDVLSYPLLSLKPGDIITKQGYPQDYDAAGKTILLGDVCICLQVAKMQAEEYGHSIEREICYLATHGVLHLLGFDHESEGDKQIMRGIEESVLKKSALVR